MRHRQDGIADASISHVKAGLGCLRPILGELFVIDRAKAQPNGSETWITFVESNIGIVPT